MRRVIITVFATLLVIACSAPAPAASVAVAVSPSALEATTEEASAVSETVISQELSPPFIVGKAYRCMSDRIDYSFLVAEDLGNGWIRVTDLYSEFPIHDYNNPIINTNVFVVCTE